MTDEGEWVRQRVVGLDDEEEEQEEEEENSEIQDDEFMWENRYLDPEVVNVMNEEYVPEEISMFGSMFDNVDYY